MVCCPEKVMFSKQYHMAPSATKVLGSNGCVASRRLCKRHCISPSPGKLSFLFFLFLIVCLSLFFWVNSLKFSWVCICFLFSFLFSLLSFFFCYGSRVFPLGVTIWGRGFSFFLGPTHGGLQWIFSKFSLSVPQGSWEHWTRKLCCRGNIAFSCIITIILGQNWLFQRFCVDWAPLPLELGLWFP